MNEKPLFEAHITYSSRHREWVEKNHSPDWKFSAIDGDPVLGKEVFCYLTSYDDSAENLLRRMVRERDRLMCCVKNEYGPGAVRMKIERIVYDTKTRRDEVLVTPSEDPVNWGSNRTWKP